MTRVPLVSAESSDAVAAVYRVVTEQGGTVPNLYRVLANAPTMLTAWTAMAWPLRADCNTPRSLRELTILRVAQLNGSDYEWTHHKPMALASGMTAAQIEALTEYTTSDVFDQTQRAVLTAVDELTTTGRLSTGNFTALEQEFDPGCLVEIILTISFYSCVSRFLAAFEIDIEPATGRTE